MNIYLEVDQTRGQYQMSISSVDEDGSGSGYRLYGPKYIGDSTPVFKVKLTQIERDKIRRYLDEADAAETAADVADTGTIFPEL